jgi:hypothetical protein
LESFFRIDSEGGREASLDTRTEAPEAKGVGRLDMNRRELLAVAGAILAAVGTRGAALAQAVPASVVPISTDAFHDLTLALTGYAPRDPSMVDAFHDAFANELTQLQRLYDILVREPNRDDWPKAIADAGLAPLAEQLIAAWYTGIAGEGEAARVITYLDAFVWYAVGYTKPPSTCDTDFGAWAVRPPGDF